MEFNPLLGKYLDAKKDEEVAQLERKSSQEELQRNKVNTNPLTLSLAQHDEKGASQVQRGEFHGQVTDVGQ